MTGFLWAGGGIAVLLIGTTVTFIWLTRDGKPGRHVSDGWDRIRLPLRRWLVVQWQVRRDHPRNMLARLRAGEGWRDAWACRFAPPMARDLAPLPPVPDRLDELVAGFAATGRLPLGATFRDGQTGVRDLGSPAGDRSPESGSLSPRPTGGIPVSVTAGRATPNQRQGLWQPHPHLARTWADDTGSFSAIDLSGPADRTLDARRPAAAMRRTGEPATYLEEFAGGDPFDGLGSVDAYLDRLFTRPLVGAR